MIRMFALAAVCISLMGCLFVVDSKQQAGRTQWYKSDAERIVNGQTEADWVKETFGEPDRISRYDNGSEIWRYRNSSSSTSEVGLFLLFHIDVERQKEEVLALEISNNRVTDYWVEKR
ncbi:MAG TPA: hypothetical protein VKZ92_07960 [Pseudohongiella sp.]|nr:hypothetical protein [Pseudohongiella sp.]